DMSHCREKNANCETGKTPSTQRRTNQGRPTPATYPSHQTLCRHARPAVRQPCRQTYSQRRYDRTVFLRRVDQNDHPAVTRSRKSTTIREPRFADKPEPRRGGDFAERAPTTPKAVWRSQ